MRWNVCVACAYVSDYLFKSEEKMIVELHTYFRTSEGSPGFEKTSALACVYPYGPDLCRTEAAPRPSAREDICEARGRKIVALKQRAGRIEAIMTQWASVRILERNVALEESLSSSQSTNIKLPLSSVTGGMTSAWRTPGLIPVCGPVTLTLGKLPFNDMSSVMGHWMVTLTL